MLAETQSSELAAALDDAVRRYAESHRESERQYKAAAQVLPGGNTRIVLHFDPFPVVIEQANRGRVTDVDGNSYIDFTNDFTAALYGHSNAEILDALRRGLEGGLSYGGPSAHERRLAEEICHRLPSLERVRFCNSGTEANLLAVQTARKVTGRSRILAFSGGYHGSMMSYLPGLTDLNVGAAGVVLAEFNNTRSVKEAAASIESDLAAIIVEPMMGSGGGIPADAGFLDFLRSFCTQTGTLLIYDEVQTARLSYGGLQEVFGVFPDLTTLGKFMGGGLAFGAFGGRGDIMDRLDPARSDRIAHGGTFNNNVLTMIAGWTGLTRLATREALEGMNNLAERLRGDLARTAAGHDVPLAVGGIGSILSLHFQSRLPRHPGEVTTPPPWRKILHLELLLRGIYAPRRGTLSLSLETSKDDCAVFVEAVDEVLTKYGDLLRPLLRQAA